MKQYISYRIFSKNFQLKFFLSCFNLFIQAGGEDENKELGLKKACSDLSFTIEDEKDKKDKKDEKEDSFSAKFLGVFKSAGSNLEDKFNSATQTVKDGINSFKQTASEVIDDNLSPKVNSIKDGISNTINNGQQAISMLNDKDLRKQVESTLESLKKTSDEWQALIEDFKKSILGINADGKIDTNSGNFKSLLKSLQEGVEKYPKVAEETVDTLKKTVDGNVDKLIPKIDEFKNIANKTYDEAAGWEKKLAEAADLGSKLPSFIKEFEIRASKNLYSIWGLSGIWQVLAKKVYLGTHINLAIQNSAINSFYFGVYSPCYNQKKQKINITLESPLIISLTTVSNLFSYINLGISGNYELKTDIFSIILSVNVQL